MAFTKENAAAYSKQAHEARWHPKLPEIAEETSAASREALPQDKYQAKTLSRVRRQLEKCFEMMAKEEDPGKIDRLASAIARLNELDRQLSNRSLPPTLKANAVNPRRKPSTTDASDPFEG